MPHCKAQASMLDIATKALCISHIYGLEHDGQCIVCRDSNWQFAGKYREYNKNGGDAVSFGE